jgi:FMN reductase
VPVAAPLIVGLGGTPRPGSTTDQALLTALEAATLTGVRTKFFGGAFLASLPLYLPGGREPTSQEVELIETVRAADGLIVGTPGYHGGVSGLVKNALDLLEDLRDDPRPYLDGRPVGCIVTAFGWQGCVTTLTALRSIVHALRGWPTPLGATLNTTEPIFDASGSCVEERSATQLTLVGRQVAGFAQLRADALDTKLGAIPPSGLATGFTP